MPGRNQPCPCGSGRKYKRCHGRDDSRRQPVENPEYVMERAQGLARQGRLDEAIPLLEKLPNTAINVQQRIAVYMQRGTEQDLLKATDLLIQQQDLAPFSAEPYLKLAEIQWRTGYNNDALGLVISAGETEPGHARIDYYLAVAMQLTGRFDSALKAYRQSVLENADETLSEAELDIEAAILAYETAAGHYPGSLHRDERKLVNAETEYNALQTALHNWQAGGPDLSTLSPGQVTRYGNAFYNLGTSDLSRYNCFHRAGEHFKACLAINPERLQARSNYLFLQNYNNISDEVISEMHIAEAAELRSQLGPPLAKFGNNPDPDKPLRIGYLSSDFRRHSVIHFITPVLAAHDRAQFQIHAYYNERKRDHWTREVESLVDVLHPVALLDDKALQQKITRDGIDILVDLNGYTKGHRVGVLMRRAAPLQVSWIGYPNTSGMDVMDYRIVDGTTDPDGADSLCSEKLIRMPETFSVYLPDPLLPPVAAEAPVLENGYVTFGSFNFLPKLNPELLGAWSEIMSAVPDSRLLIKNQMLGEPAIIRSLEEAFTAAGIDPARITMAGRTDPAIEHMKFYNQVDLCLDSWPYNGTTTTCDSLIMGVPVLAMAGAAHRSRVSASQLQAVGLHRQLVAADRAEYVKMGIRLASDHMMLNNLRQGLRERVQQSPLMDANAFTRALETHFRQIWAGWCSEEN